MADRDSRLTTGRSTLPVQDGRPGPSPVGGADSMATHYSPDGVQKGVKGRRSQREGLSPSQDPPLLDVPGFFPYLRRTPVTGETVLVSGIRTDSARPESSSTLSAETRTLLLGVLLSPGSGALGEPRTEDSSCGRPSWGRTGDVGWVRTTGEARYPRRVPFFHPWRFTGQPRDQYPSL